MCTPPAFTQSSPHRDGTRSTTSAPLPSSCHPGFSPTLIYDPVDISSPQTAISPGAPLARSRLSASGFSLLHASRPTVSRSPHRFICPRSPSHLRAQPITALSSADIRPTRIFHVSEFPDTLRSPNVPPNRHVPSMPIPVPRPNPRPFDSAQYSSAFYGPDDDDEENLGSRERSYMHNSPARSGSSDWRTCLESTESYRASQFGLL